MAQNKYVWFSLSEGDAMLASIALVAGDKVIFKDFAQFDQYSTWRVDDGAINPDMFRILFCGRKGEPSFKPGAPFEVKTYIYCGKRNRS